jgi:dTMP kinase
VAARLGLGPQTAPLPPGATYARADSAGRFITFEGGEGSGKSTQAQRLAEQLHTQGIGVVLTREPGGTPFAERVRTLLLDPRTPPHSALSEALLFYAARADHLAGVIRPALAAGRWVVCDRFSDSTRVYQGVAGGVNTGLIGTLEHMIVEATEPDLTIVIDVPVRDGLARAMARKTSAPRGAGIVASDEDAYETRDVAFHERLREGFLSIAKLEPERCVVIDGLLPACEVAERVWTAVRERLMAGHA